MATLAPRRRLYLGLGGNQGDRDQLLRAALQRLAPQVQIVRCSSLYETPPWGYPNQPPFLNAVAEALTTFDPLPLLALLKRVERQLGRVAGPRYGPRPIDIDLLLYDDLRLDHPDLTIPHPRIAERSFVLVPLVELDPTLRLDPSGPTVAELLTLRKDRAAIQKVGPPPDLESGAAPSAVL